MSKYYDPHFYEKNYRKQIDGENKKLYQTTIKEFETWLDEENMRETFFKDLYKEYLYVDEIEQTFFVATDYAIPVVMVKYYKRKG